MMIEEMREYVFALFAMLADGNGVDHRSRQYLGTGFFVSRLGDAISAAHVLPKPEALGQDRRLVAVVIRNGAEHLCMVSHAAHFADWDVALLRVNLSDTKYLRISAAEVVAGTDIEIVGIPDHEVWGRGKEMRVLKGHVTMASRFLEVSCAVPLGMSGSPVLMAGTVIGWATGTVRGEQIEESTEDVKVAKPEREIVTRTEIRRFMYYGLVVPFLLTADAPDPVLNGKTLPDFIRHRNDGTTSPGDGVGQNSAVGPPAKT